MSDIRTFSCIMEVGSILSKVYSTSCWRSLQAAQPTMTNCPSLKAQFISMSGTGASPMQFVHVISFNLWLESSSVSCFPSTNQLYTSALTKSNHEISFDKMSAGRVMFEKNFSLKLSHLLPLILFVPREMTHLWWYEDSYKCTHTGSLINGVLKNTHLPKTLIRGLLLSSRSLL